MNAREKFGNAFHRPKRKGYIALAYIIRSFFLFAFIYALWQGEVVNCIVAAASLLLTFIPAILSRAIHVFLPTSYQFVLLLFIFCSQMLGELRGYYLRFWWWDILLHTSSGVLLGFVGFLLIYVLNEATQVSVVMGPFFMALFSFIFAVAAGAVWEIFEFAMDQIFGFNMQKSGLMDTMSDLIVDTIGALIASINGFIHIKHRKTNYYDRFIAEFLEKNPQFINKV